jgi:hypothetical protein
MARWSLIDGEVFEKSHFRRRLVAELSLMQKDANYALSIARATARDQPRRSNSQAIQFLQAISTACLGLHASLTRRIRIVERSEYYVPNHDVFGLKHIPVFLK